MISVANLYAAASAAAILVVIAVLAHQLASAMQTYLPLRIGYNVYESVVDQLGDVGCVVVRDAATMAMESRSFHKYVEAVSRVVASWDAELSKYGVHIRVEVDEWGTKYLVRFARFNHSVLYRVWVRCAVETLRAIDSIRVVRGGLPRFCAPVRGYIRGILHRVDNSSVYRGVAYMYLTVSGGDLPCGNPITSVYKPVTLVMELPHANSSSVRIWIRVG